MSTSDDGNCCAALIAVGLVGVLVMAPHWSLDATNGQAGPLATALAWSFLALTAAGPFIPRWGMLIGAQWSVYMLWLSGYFSVVSGLTDAAASVADPAAGWEGFLLALLMLVITITMALLLFLAVPAAVGIAGAVLYGLPATLVSAARRLDPWRNWSAAQDAGVAGWREDTFPLPRWRAPHNRGGDASLRRRRRLTVAALVVYGLAIAATAAVVLGPFVAPGGRYAAFVAVWAVATAAALVQWLLSRTVQRDLLAWRLPDDDYLRLHRGTVDLANRWAATVHPADLREGRPVVESLLRDSEDAMNAAQRLDPVARREAQAAGPGWSPPAVRDLAGARHSLETINRRMVSLLAAGQSYADAREDADQRRRLEAVQRRVDEDLAVVDAAVQTYWEYYADLWRRLRAARADGGLPDPDRFRIDRARPTGLPAADLPPALATLTDLLQELLAEPCPTDAGDALAGRRREFITKCTALRDLADLTLAAGARLALSGGDPPATVPLDDRGLDELIGNIRARIAAEEEVERRWD